MNIDISQIIGNPESELLEYKAVLPPARSLAQLIAGFANAKGGIIVLGVFESNGSITVTGLSEDFHANSVTHKALDLLYPRPVISYDHISYGGKRLYLIQISKSDSPVSIENKFYVRRGSRTELSNVETGEEKMGRLEVISDFAKTLSQQQSLGTGAKQKFIDHYSSVLNLIDDLRDTLFPDSPDKPTLNQEGKILSRILFSSCADNFEIYLSDLLYEIYLAKPTTLKSSHQVTIKEVLECADMQEFVMYWAKKKLDKLQRGSVKGFIAENTQINDLNILDVDVQTKIEQILQIRHLYSHRNGIVDERFLQFFAGKYSINEEHKLSVHELISYMVFLSDIVDKVDNAAIGKYSLVTLL
jgi:hypothetical protein